MVHKPGHLQFDDDSAPKRAAPGAPKALDFGSPKPDEKAGRAPMPHRSPPKPKEPAPLFGEGGASIAPALDHARSAFPDLAKAEAHSIERKIRQLTPWRQEIVSTWGSKALDENAAITVRVAQLINSCAEYGINELVEKALSVSRRGESGLLSRLFLRGKIISYGPALRAARSQLAQLIGDCGACAAALQPLDLQLRSSLAALVSAREALPRAREDAIEAAIHSRRLLLQQAIHQAELTALQLQELKRQMAVQLTQVDRLLTITIPAFEIADAGK